MCFYSLVQGSWSRALCGRVMAPLCDPHQERGSDDLPLFSKFLTPLITKGFCLQRPDRPSESSFSFTDKRDLPRKMMGEIQSDITWHRLDFQDSRTTQKSTQCRKCLCCSAWENPSFSLFLQSLCLLGFTLLLILFLTSSRFPRPLSSPLPTFFCFFAFLNSISSLARSGTGGEKEASQGCIDKILFDLSGFLLAHTAPWWQKTKSSAAVSSHTSCYVNSDIFYHSYLMDFEVTLPKCFF